MLFDYLQATQRFLREQKQDLLNPEDLVAYINTARREVALRTQCVRVLTPSSGQITGWSVTDGGSGYSADPTLAVSTPDAPSGMLPYPNGDTATATAIVQDGEITAIESTYGGAGYFAPTLTITDATGEDATADPIIGGINLLEQGQEKYDFSDIDLSANPGCDSVYFVRSASVIYSNWRYSLIYVPFSWYQAKIRNYPNTQFQYVPSFFTQFAQGNSGSIFFYPLPSQQYQLELDCLCLPSDLIDDQSFDVLPKPWTDAVPFYAAHLAFLELQNLNASAAYLKMYEARALSYSNYTRIGRQLNPYGRA